MKIYVLNQDEFNKCFALSTEEKQKIQIVQLQSNVLTNSPQYEIAVFGDYELLEKLVNVKSTSDTGRKDGWFQHVLVNQGGYYVKENNGNNTQKSLLSVSGNYLNGSWDEIFTAFQKDVNTVSGEVTK